MNGQSTLNTWLKKNDPLAVLTELFDIYISYNKESNTFLDKIKRWWIEKVTYPLLRFKVHRVGIKTAKLLFEHPDLLVFVLTRFLICLQVYVDKYGNTTVEDLLNILFPPNTISLRIDRDIVGSQYSILGYSLNIRSPLVIDLNNISSDKFAILSLDANIQRKDYTISQIVYNTDSDNISLAPIIYNKEFRLTANGKLSNPNYVLDHTLLDEDLVYYRLMISQIMSFIGGFFDELTKIYFLKTKLK